MIKKIKKTIVVLLALISLGGVANADYLPIQIQATDAVAGFPAAFKSSIIDPSKNVRFVVEKPDGSVVQIPAQSDLEGIAKAELYGHQTKQAGEYKVALVYSGSKQSSPQSSFSVYADEVSLSQSTLRSTLQLAEATKDTTFLVVTLLDQYRNPIKNHRVKLLSSRSEDVIETLNEGLSDENGRANFKVSSLYSGISVFTALDVTANKVLEDREEIVFFSPNEVKKEPSIVDLFKADIGGEPAVQPGPVHRFKIEDISSTVKVGDQLSVTVIAEDKNGNVAKNYTGTILISVPDDENAALPNNGEYTFRATDQGKFTFDLSLQFSKLGNQVVQVFDKSNFKISGEKKVEVISGGNVPVGSSSGSLVIKSPSDKAEIGNSLVVITGKGPENINLKVFDNDVKIGDSETDSDGFFTFDAKNLSSGAHQLYVMSEKGEVSESVSIKIDTLPPALSAFSVNPTGRISPAADLSFKIQSEPNLSSVKVRFQGIEQPMAEKSDQPGNYVLDTKAPVKEGEFSVDVILVDLLGNKAELLNKGSITVKKPAPVAPSQVKDLLAQAGEDFVSLSWKAAEGLDSPISYYKIYYGIDFNDLSQVAQTSDNRTSFKLEGLRPSVQYFMAAKAVNAKGIESDSFSATVAVTTLKAAPQLNCGLNGVESNGVCICSNGWSGNECQISPVQNTVGSNGLFATPHKGAVTLNWNEFNGIQAYYYKVFIGFSPQNFTDFVVTPNNQRTLTINDLIPSQTYYFAIAPLALNRAQLAPVSGAIQVIPNGSALRPAASNVNTAPLLTDQKVNKVPKTNEVGSETWWIILASVIFAHFLYHRKKKMIQP